MQRARSVRLAARRACVILFNTISYSSLESIGVNVSLAQKDLIGPLPSIAGNPAS
jgi:hypothetical protein